MPHRIRVTWGGAPGVADFATDRTTDQARVELFPYPWTWLHQVHGSTVVVVNTPGEHAGAEADAAVTAVPGAALAIHTADCAPVLFFDAGVGVIGAAHAGWRGLADGVLEATVAAMADLGAVDVSARLGPHIRGRCYEFGDDELAMVADRYGDDVRTTTAWGTPALDVTTAVHVALAPLDVSVHDQGGCTACEPRRYFSHRARTDAGRHVSAIAVVP